MWELKVHKPVDEQTFLKYLNKVCQNEELKNYVLEYYERLKKQDEKTGPVITKETFGTPSEKFVNGQLFNYDIVKDLFSSTDKISRADFFRYQFLNYVNDIDMVDKLKGNTNGAYDSKEKTIKVLKKNIICKLDDNKINFDKFLNGKIDEKEYIKNYFSEEKAEKLLKTERRLCLFHELTHAMTCKTLDNGKFLELQSHKNRDNFTKSSHTLWCSKFVYFNEQLESAFENGMTIVNEIFTELYSYKEAMTIFYVNKFNNKYSSTFDMGSKYEIENTPCYYSYKYQDFSYLAKMFSMFNFWHKPEKYLLNPRLLENKLNGNGFAHYRNEINDVVFNYFSNKMKKANKTFDSKKLKQDISKISHYELFLVVIGELDKNYDDNNNILYTKLGRTLQALLLNQYTNSVHTKFNELLSDIKENKEQKTYKEMTEDNEKAKELLKNEFSNAKYLQKWIIKNNDFVKTHGFDSRIVMPSDEISEHDFARMEAKNEINIEIWDDYIKLLIDTAYKIAPEMLKKDEFFAREAQSFAREAQLNKQLDKIKYREKE